MDPISGIRESLAGVFRRVATDKQQLSNLRAKSDAGVVKVKAKRKEIEDAIAGIRTTDGVSFDSIVSVSRKLEVLMSEVHSLLMVNYHVVLLKDFLDSKEATSKQLISSRSAKMEELQKMVLAWEDQFNPDIDKKMAQFEENKKMIVEKKTMLRGIDDGFFNKKVSVEQKKNLKKDLAIKLERIKGENTSANTTSTTLNKLNDAWLAASQQQVELDKLICPLIEHLQIIEGDYTVLLDIQAAIQVDTNRLIELENLIETVTKEEIELAEKLKNCNEQVSALNLGIETRTMMFDGTKTEQADYISKLSKLIEDADHHNRDLEKETADLKAASDVASINADSIQSEYDLWKKSLQERLEEMDSDEENELDGEIAEVRAEIAYLQEQASIRGAGVKKAQDCDSKMDQPFKMVKLQVESPVQVQDSNQQKELSQQDKVKEDDMKINMEEEEYNINVFTQEITISSQSDPSPETSATNSAQNTSNIGNVIVKEPEQLSADIYKQIDDFFNRDPELDSEVMDLTSTEEISVQTIGQTQDKKRGSNEESNTQKSMKKDENHLSPSNHLSSTATTSMDEKDKPTNTKSTSFYIRPQLTPNKQDYPRASTSSISNIYCDIMGAKEKEKERGKEKEKEKPSAGQDKLPQRKSFYKPTQSLVCDIIDDPIKAIEDLNKEDKYSQRTMKTRKMSQKKVRGSKM